MRIPRWLLPVLAVVAALAVGIAAVLVGMRFAPAPPASAFVPPDTETAQVLQPLPVEASDPDGDASTGPDGDGSGDGSTDGGDDSGEGTAPEVAPLPGESPVTGETEVAVAEEDPAASDTELLRLIDLVGLSPDLLAGLIHLAPFDLTDDPCAPRDGSAPAASCPPGAPGSVFLDGDIPPLWMTVDAWPQTHAQAPVYLGAPHRPLSCDPAPREEGSADLRIRVTSPGSWTIRYWPDDDPSAVQTTEPITTTDAQNAEWSDESADVAHGRYIIEHCVRLPGVDLGMPYTAVVEGTDLLGRSPGAQTVHFHGDGAPVRPGLSVQPIGQNLLVVTAPHASGETVDLRAYLVDDTTADCSAPGEGLRYLSHVDHVAVSNEERRHLNAPDDITEKLMYSYRVPEGATLLMCGRWFPGEGAHDWVSDQATFESSVIVQSPDRNLPTITFTRFDSRDDRTVDLDWTVSTTQGLECGTWNWSSGGELPQLMCGTYGLAGGGAVGDGGTFGDPERIADRGFTGDLVLRVTATLSSGETSETTYELPAGAGSCVGVCPLPSSDSFGVATIGGTMMVRRDWSTGLQNGGLDEWVIGSIDSNPIDYVRPDGPRIDDDVAWQFSEPTFSPTVRGTIDIPVDRPVDWQLSAYTDPATGAGMSCAATPAPLAASGHTDTETIHITVPDLCLGASYQLELRLVDDDGHVAVWNIVDRANWWRFSSQLRVPALHVNMRWRVDVFGSGGQYLHAFALSVGGADYAIENRYADERGPRCVRSDGVVMSEGSRDVYLTAKPVLGLKYQTSPRRSGPGCTAYAFDAPPTPWVQEVPITQLGRLDGVLMDSGNQHVHLWFDRL